MTGLPMFIPGTAPGTDPLDPLVRAALAEGRPFPRAMAPGEVWVGETLPSPEALAAVLGGPADAGAAPFREPSSIMMAPGAIDYELLDPGIRGVVRWLNEHGYATSDSGDGVAKIAAGDDEAIPTPHACIAATRDTLLDTADRLRRDLAEIGVDVANQGPDFSSPSIQASYDPGDGGAAIMLYGVNDETLQGAEAMAVFEATRGLRARATAAVMGDGEIPAPPQLDIVGGAG